ncbi:hypothetical protein WK64_31735 [Burkholderia ubonensis]|nr:hypothetical protein WK64_31735 [Burkholderia ubonensis]
MAAAAPADERAPRFIRTITHGRELWQGGAKLAVASSEAIASEIASALNARAAASPAASIPDGYALVPKRITAAMIESAMEHHYGKRRARQNGGAGGIVMTVNDTDWSGIDAMRRLWKGALAAAPQPAQADAQEGLTADQRAAVEFALGACAGHRAGEPHVAALESLLAVRHCQPDAEGVNEDAAGAREARS